jgi:YesN/AraC family two-component response regulator
MNLYVKSMVSQRCKMVVQEELLKLGLHEVSVELGKVVIIEHISTIQREQFREALHITGLELLDDKREIIIERVKNVVTDLIYNTVEAPLVNFSVFLSVKMGYDYIYLANLFSELNGCTLEHYVIANKIERVKELLLEDEMNLSEISYLMHYSSVSHLSAQFKKETGFTPSCFKNNGDYAGRQFVECI